MPNLEVKCSKEMESFFLENDGELLRKMQALLKDYQSLDPLTGEPKNTAKYNMEEGREYTMVPETREVNRHHYNDKPRKSAKARPKNLEPNSSPDQPAFEMPAGAINTHCQVRRNAECDHLKGFQEPGPPRPWQFRHADVCQFLLRRRQPWI